MLDRSKDKIDKIREYLNEIDQDARRDWCEFIPDGEAGIEPLLNSKVLDFKAEIDRNLRSIVMVVDKSVILEAEGAKKVLIWSEPLHRRKVSNEFNICSETHFANQPSAFSIGSGFFVEDGIIATAAHVVVDKSPENLRFIHGVVARSRSDFEHHFIVDKSMIYKPQIDSFLEEGSFELFTNSYDWAVLKVEPAYEGFSTSETNKPIPVRFPENDRPWAEEAVYGCGHGLGLPAKVVFDGDIKRLPTNKRMIFECSSTLYGGNSGSPVFFFETHELAGVYSGGTKKLELSDKNGKHCFDVKNIQANKHNLSDYEGQECQSWQKIFGAVNQLRNLK